ncbi:MAG: hypothetical protein V1845_01745 [bacterium]
MKEKLRMRLLWDFDGSSAKFTDLLLPDQTEPTKAGPRCVARHNCYHASYVLVRQKDNQHGQITTPLWWAHGQKNDPRVIATVTQRINPLIADGKFTDFYLTQENWLSFIFHLPKNSYFPLIAFKRGILIITQVLGIPKNEVKHLKLQLTPLVKPAGTTEWTKLQDFLIAKARFDGGISIEG